MKNLTIFLSILLILSFISSGFSQGVVARAKCEVKIKPKDKTEVKTYNLTPKFTKDMSWSETVECVEIQNINYEHYSYHRKHIINFKSQVQLGDYQKEAHKKIEYTEIKGKSSLTYSWDGDDSSDPTITEIKDAYIKCKIIENNFVEVSESKNIDKLVLACYPAGPFFGFQAPVKEVKIGDEWKSDILVPANFKQAEEMEDFKVSKIEGKFKLVDVKFDKEKKIDVAEVSWTGTGEGKVDSDVFDASWERTIKFDITNSRTLSNDGSLKLDLMEYGDVVIKLKQTFTYAKDEAPKADEEPDKPKGEED